MSVAVRRVVTGFLALIVCLFLLPIDALFEAGLQFVAAGVLPGVGVVVSPTETMLLLSELALLIVLLIFRREFTRAVTSEPMFEYTRQVSDASVPKPVVVIRVPAKPGRLPLLVRKLVAAIPTPVRRYVTTLHLRMLLWFYKALYHAVIAREHLRVRAKRLLLKLGKLLKRASKEAYRFTRLTYKRAVPYLWQLDRYIETQVKQSQAYAFLLKKSREVKPLIASWRQSVTRAWATITAKTNF